MVREKSSAEGTFGTEGQANWSTRFVRIEFLDARGGDHALGITLELGPLGCRYKCNGRVGNMSELDLELSEHRIAKRHEALIAGAPQFTSVDTLLPTSLNGAQELVHEFLGRHRRLSEVCPK